MNNILKVVYDRNSTYSYENVIEWLGFDNINDVFTEKKSLVGIGPNHSLICRLSEKYQDYYKMFLIPEEPNAYFANHAYNLILDVENTFDLIFTICKYTKEWRKNYFDVDKRIYIPTPFSISTSHPSEEKTIPVYFTGHTRPSPILPYIFNAVKKFNGVIVDGAQYKPVTPHEKMILNGQSKISITYNLLFLTHQHVASIMSIPNWKNNEAFKNLDSLLVPQLKTRVFEAALSKSIILHKWDEWNVIEDWYTPNEDFIYFDDEKDLLEKIDEINKNYEGYKYIAENAYNKTINNYTTDHFIKKYILPNTKLEV